MVGRQAVSNFPAWCAHRLRQVVAFGRFPAEVEVGVHVAVQPRHEHHQLREWAKVAAPPYHRRRDESRIPELRRAEFPDHEVPDARVQAVHQRQHRLADRDLALARPATPTRAAPARRTRPPRGRARSPARSPSTRCTAAPARRSSPSAGACGRDVEVRAVTQHHVHRRISSAVRPGRSRGWPPRRRRRGLASSLVGRRHHRVQRDRVRCRGHRSPLLCRVESRRGRTVRTSATPHAEQLRQDAALHGGVPA